MKKKKRECIDSSLAVLFEESPLYFPTEAGLQALETLMATPETRLICQNPLYIMALPSPQFSLPHCELLCLSAVVPSLSPLFSYLLPYSVFLVTLLLLTVANCVSLVGFCSLSPILRASGFSCQLNRESLTSLHSRFCLLHLVHSPVTFWLL